MLKSMTGFACKTIELTNRQGEKGFLTINIKSLNSRHFEVSTKLPPALQSVEVGLISALKKKLHRGKVTVTLSYSNPNLFKGPVQVSMVTLRGYLTALEQVRTQAALEGQLHLADVINLPNVLVIEEMEADQAIKHALETACNQVMQELSTLQEKEGKALYEDIKSRIALIQQSIDQIAEAAISVFTRKKEDTERKLAQFPSDFSELEHVRRQLQIELERSDIHEEIVRFKTHLNSLQELIQASTVVEKGRQIDFIVQELSREINTAAAKCADSTISSKAISIKVELEKIREQAQNVI